MIRKTHEPDITEEWLVNCSKEEFRRKLKLLNLRITLDAGE